MNVRISLEYGFDLNVHWDGVDVNLDDTKLTLSETRLLISALTEIVRTKETN